MQSQDTVEEMLRKELGLLWMRGRRCFDVSHFTLRQLFSFMWMAYFKGSGVKKTIDMCVEQIERSSD